MQTIEQLEKCVYLYRDFFKVIEIVLRCKGGCLKPFALVLDLSSSLALRYFLSQL